MPTFNKHKLHAHLRSLQIASTLICPSILQKEQELAEIKWFAYRFMPPLEATLEFGRLYQKATQQYVRKNVDLDLSKSVLGTNLDIPIKQTSTFTQLWQARQEADRSGIPYEHYLEFCFDFASRRERKTTPRPNQLGPNRKTRGAWEATFQQFLDRGLELYIRSATMPPQFRFEAFRGFQSQIAFRDVILKLIGTSNQPHHMEIANWSGVKRLIPIRSAVDPKHRHTMIDAISTIRRERALGIMPKHPEPFAALSENEYWPSCLGVAYAKDDAKSGCSTCPFAQECDAVNQRIATLTKKPAALNAETGAAKRKSMMSDDRVRRFRARKKAAPHAMQAVIDYRKLHPKKNRKRDSYTKEI